MKEAQQVVAEKTSALEAEAYKTKRLQVKNVWQWNSFLLLQYFIPINNQIKIRSSECHVSEVFVSVGIVINTTQPRKVTNFGTM